MAADESPCPLVTVLFARRDSIYKSMAGCDVWDADRDALNWPGDSPVLLLAKLRGLSSFLHRGLLFRRDLAAACLAALGSDLGEIFLEFPFHAIS